MKLTQSIAILLPLAVYASPVTDLEAASSIRCTVTRDGVYYRICPCNSCEVVGRYGEGTQRMDCHDRADITTKAMRGALAVDNCLILVFSASLIFNFS